uniref:Uncharacterized protein n=1 Tax=Arundo donax TaxID=35708 RepID=A0A0A8YU52_ARUDO
MSILEDLVLRQSCDPLLEVAVADGQYRPLLIQKCHPRRQYGHLVLQGCDAALELGDVLQLPYPRPLSRLPISQNPLHPLGVPDQLRGGGGGCGLPRRRLLGVPLVVVLLVHAGGGGALVAVAVAAAVLGSRRGRASGLVGEHGHELVVVEPVEFIAGPAVRRRYLDERD